MNDEPYRAALIGLGRIADTIDDETVGSGWLEPFSHMGSYMDVPEVLVVGAADRYPEQREAFGQRWGVPEEKLYENYQEMLERERPDIVSICTHVAPRAEITLDIVRMVREGRTSVKCIWVEKPMAVSLLEADSMVEACREAGVILMLNAMRASDVYYRRARALIDEGVLGRMLQITAHGSGPLAHMGVHWLGAMCVLAGGNERVSWLVGEAESDEKANSGGDLAGNAYLAYENGARGFCRMMPSGASTWTLDAIGEKGTISIRNGNEGYEFELWRMGQVRRGRPTDPGAVRLPATAAHLECGCRASQGRRRMHRVGQDAQLLGRHGATPAGNRHCDSRVAPPRERPHRSAARRPEPGAA